MPLRNTQTLWGWPARALHWAMAFIIAFQLIVGTYMTGVDDLAARFALTQTHKSWGFVVFALALARVAWRLANPTPTEPAGRPWEKLAARVSHGALYLLMFLMPVSGWLMASASDLQDMYGVKNMVFGLFELPDPFVPGDRGLEGVFSSIHTAAAVALAALLAIHAGAALKHHLIDRDDVLTRMTVKR
ncbi:cytochrome b [Rubrimonas cliftonensis]|uniref:Cytochrome b561 n=1 Tax=Rubrimonas cliftonensis TaxID=89524 RepID=A0A1H4C2C1_9RHOB|nr:cytochrome b [Rubrimonas cliftonensis]SEA54561.1 cytochrome b561 [Rubrimonas cliftonensis]